MALSSPPARSGVVMVTLMLQTALAATSLAQIPDRPVITEVYTDPPGLNDGPVGRDPTNANQEYIEIYIPTCAVLSTLWNCDALRLTFYEVEGDAPSSGVEQVNYRFDLPTFDLDPGNGITPGAIPRPPNGVVVLGWLDYVGNPPTDLAGTPGTRVAMINGGVTSVTGCTFVAINGNHFTGTTNFPTVVAENLIDLPNEASSGIIQNGSSAFLLVNRDALGYEELCDDKHAVDCVAGAHPHLPDDNLNLKSDSLHDGFASNDHTRFRVIQQPYATPTGKDIDLETVLPLGGAFSLLVAQCPESDSSQPEPGFANGYARTFVDTMKTTENATPLDDDPIVDTQVIYQQIRNDGPFFATPCKAIFSTSPPELSVARAPEQFFNVLVGTTGGPGVLAANIGGNSNIDLTASPGPSSDASVATFATGAASLNIPGQSFGFPALTVALGPSALAGAIATATVTVTASNSNTGDPAVLAPVQMTTMTATVINPTTGLDATGLVPLQATVFAAIQGVPDQIGVANEFLLTDLGAAAAANLGFAIQAGRGHGAILADPTTNLHDPFFVNIALVEDMPNPNFPNLFINAPAPPVAGKLDLVQTVLQSAETLSGSGTYDANVNATQTGVRARRLNHPDIFTFGGTFTPSEVVHFAAANGAVGNPRSGLTNATTTRGFELAILDANIRDNNTIEDGATDDFGIIVEVLDVEPGSPVVPGEYVFLSLTGGRQGTDIDSLNVPGGPNIITITFLDLDNLHDVLGIRTIEQIFLIDSASNGEIEEIEVYALNPVFIPECLVAADCDDANPCTTDTCLLTGFCDHTTLADGTNCDDGLFCNGTDTCQTGVCTTGALPCPAGCDLCDEAADTCSHCRFDLDFDATGVIGTGDFGIFSGCFGQTYVPTDPQYTTCLSANFDDILNLVTGEYAVGTGDFGVFSGCFAQDCASCTACIP